MNLYQFINYFSSLARTFYLFNRLRTLPDWWYYALSSSSLYAFSAHLISSWCFFTSSPFIYCSSSCISHSSVSHFLLKAVVSSACIFLIVIVSSLFFCLAPLCSSLVISFLSFSAYSLYYWAFLYFFACYELCICARAS